MQSIRRSVNPRATVAPRESQSAQAIYDGHDIYFKGAWVLHTLRWLIGDDAFFRALRRMAYPDSAVARTTDGSAVRFVSTVDFETIAEAESGRDLDWFFDVYLHRPELPELRTEESGGQLTLEWATAAGAPFPLPVEIRVGDRVRRVEMPAGGATVAVPDGAEVVIDPASRILRAR